MLLGKFWMIMMLDAAVMALCLAFWHFVAEGSYILKAFMNNHILPDILLQGCNRPSRSSRLPQPGKTRWHRNWIMKSLKTTHLPRAWPQEPHHQALASLSIFFSFDSSNSKMMGFSYVQRSVWKLLAGRSSAQSTRTSPLSRCSPLTAWSSSMQWSSHLSHGETVETHPTSQARLWRDRCSQRSNFVSPVIMNIIMRIVMRLVWLLLVWPSPNKSQNQPIGAKQWCKNWRPFCWFLR